MEPAEVKQTNHKLHPAESAPKAFNSPICILARKALKITFSDPESLSLEDVANQKMGYLFIHQLFNLTWNTTTRWYQQKFGLKQLADQFRSWNLFELSILTYYRAVDILGTKKTENPQADQIHVLLGSIIRAIRTLKITPGFFLDGKPNSGYLSEARCSSLYQTFWEQLELSPLKELAPKDHNLNLDIDFIFSEDSLPEETVTAEMYRILLKIEQDEKAESAALKEVMHENAGELPVLAALIGLNQSILRGPNETKKAHSIAHRQAMACLATAAKLGGYTVSFPNQNNYRIDELIHICFGYHADKVNQKLEEKYPEVKKRFNTKLRIFIHHLFQSLSSKSDKPIKSKDETGSSPKLARTNSP